MATEIGPIIYIDFFELCHLSIPHIAKALYGPEVPPIA